MRKVIQSVIYFLGRYAITAGPALHRSATCMVFYADDYGTENDYRQAYQSVLNQLLLPLNEITTTTIVESSDPISGNDVKTSNEGDTVISANNIPLKRMLSTKGNTNKSDFEDNPEIVEEDSRKINFEGFLTAVENLVFDGVSTEHWRTLFNRFANVKDTIPQIGEKDFIDICNQELGFTRKVVIKFMSQRDQWLRELDGRERMDLNPRYVVDVIRCATEMELKEETIRFATIDNRFLEKRHIYVMIMPAADRNLDSIFRFERPDLLYVRTMMYDIGMSLNHMHTRGLMHGDLKMLNIVRVQQHVRLIDLDAVAKVKDDVNITGIPSYAGEAKIIMIGE